MASSYAMHTVQRKVSAQTAASSSTLRQRQGQTRKVNDCFILLKRITRLKSVHADSKREMVSPETAGSCSTSRRATGETMKKAICFALPKRISENSEIMSEDQTSYLDRYSPRGSRHLVVKRPEKVSEGDHRHSQHSGSQKLF